MSLSGHLTEFRKRLFRSAVFVLLGSIGGWFLFDPVFQMLQKPVLDVSAEKHIQATINFGSVVGALDLRTQVSIFLGILISSPIWLYQLWAFLSPGLKNKERKWTLTFMATALPLFFAGCYMAWVALPGFIVSMLSFTPQGSANVINASEYILFTLRILLVFGVAFVLPAVLVLLNAAGIITAKGILKSWRLAVFVIAVIGALATPVSDPMSMFLVMAPMVALFFAAAAIAWGNDKRRARRTVEAEVALEAELSE
jgi:sec-independent protein translocase protein TatC